MPGARWFLGFLVCFVALAESLSSDNATKFSTTERLAVRSRTYITFQQTLRFKHGCPDTESCEKLIKAKRKHAKKAVELTLTERIEYPWGICETDRPVCSVEMKILDFKISTVEFDHDGDTTCDSRFCVEIETKYIYIVTAASKVRVDDDQLLVRIGRVEKVMAQLHWHRDMITLLVSSGSRSRSDVQVFYLSHATDAATVDSRGIVNKMGRTYKPYYIVDRRQESCIKAGYMAIETEHQCRAAGIYLKYLDSSSDRSSKHKKSKHTLQLKRSPRHRTGCFRHDAAGLIIFNKASWPNARNGYGNEICYAPPATTTPALVTTRTITTTPSATTTTTTAAATTTTTHILTMATRFTAATTTTLVTTRITKQLSTSVSDTVSARSLASTSTTIKAVHCASKRNKLSLRKCQKVLASGLCAGVSDRCESTCAGCDTTATVTASTLTRTTVAFTFSSVSTSPSKTVVPSTSVRIFSSGKAATSATSTLSRCQTCIDMCVHHHCVKENGRPCDVESPLRTPAKKTCWPYCARHHGCPKKIISTTTIATNQTTPVLRSWNQVPFSLSPLMTLIIISSVSVLTVVITLIVIFVSIRRAAAARKRVVDFQGVQTTSVSTFPNPSFDGDADEDWSVAMVMDSMMESPLHQMIRQRDRSISCGSEDMGRDRQQSEEPELIPSYSKNSQLRGISGNSSTFDEPSKLAFEKHSFDKDDEELRMDTDGRWYTRAEFRVEYGSLRQWHAAPRAIPESEDSEENDEVLISPAPASTINSCKVNHHVHDDSSDEEHSDHNETVLAANQSDPKLVKSSTRTTRTVSKVVTGPRAKPKKDAPAVSKAKNGDASGKDKYEFHAPQTAMIAKVRAGPSQTDKYTVAMVAAGAIGSRSSRQRNTSKDDKYSVPTTSPTASPTKPSASKRTRRPRLRTLKRQRRHRRKRNSHDDMVSTKPEQASGDRTLDRYTIPKTKVIGRAMKRSDADTKKYIASTSVNPKVVNSGATAKDEYYVDTPLQTVHASSRSTHQIDKNKYAATSPATAVKVIAGSSTKTTKTNYTAKTRKLMSSINKHSDTESDDKYTISISSQSKKMKCVPSTKEEYEVDPKVINVKNTSGRDIHSDKYTAKHVAVTQPGQANRAKSVLAKSDPYAVDIRAAKGPATREAYRDGDKYAVPQQTQNKVAVPPTSSAATPVVDTHALVSKVAVRSTPQQRKTNADNDMFEVPTDMQTKVVKSEANDRYTVEPSPASLHSIRKANNGDETKVVKSEANGRYNVEASPASLHVIRKANNGDDTDKYDVPCPRVTLETADAPTRAEPDTRIVPTTGTGTSSGDSKADKYAVSSTKLKLAPKRKMATNQADQREATNVKKNGGGADKYDVPIACKSIVNDSVQAEDKYAVKVDTNVSLAAAALAAAESRRALRRQRLRALKRRRERRRRDRRSTKQNSPKLGKRDNPKTFVRPTRQPRQDAPGKNDTTKQNNEKTGGKSTQTVR